jgi:DNA-directed RNA polymerase subunit omega
MIPPQVSSTSRKPLSIAFEEIAAGKIVWTEAPEEAEVEVDPEAEAQAMADATGEGSADSDEG